LFIIVVVAQLLTEYQITGLGFLKRNSKSALWATLELKMGMRGSARKVYFIARAPLSKRGNLKISLGIVRL